MASSIAVEQRYLQLFGRKCPWDEERLKLSYSRLSGGKASGMNLALFQQVITDVFKLVMPSPDSLLAQRLFSVFLRARPDTISFAELITGLQVLSSDDVEAKLQLTFKAFDFEDTGFITQDNITSVATELCAHLFRKSPINRITKALTATYPSYCLRTQLLGAPEFIKLATESGSQELTVVLSLFSIGATANDASTSDEASTTPTTGSSSSSSSSSNSGSEATSSTTPVTATTPTRQRRQVTPTSGSATGESAGGEASAVSPAVQRKLKRSSTSSPKISEQETSSSDADLSEFELRLVTQIRGLQAELRKKIAQCAEHESTIQTLEKTNKELSVRLTESTVRSEQMNEQLHRQLDDTKQQLECLCQWVFEPLLGVDPKEEHFDPPHASNVIKVGYILKEQDVLKHWKRRLFMLRSTGDLYWFTRAEAPKIRGQTSVRAHQLRKRPNTDTLANALDLATPEREIHLLFKDPATVESWASALQSVRRTPPSSSAAATSRRE